MISWILDNLATILISSLLIVIVISIIQYLIRQKRDGKNSCGCDCGHCSMHGSCHGSNGSARIPKTQNFQWFLGILEGE